MRRAKQRYYVGLPYFDALYMQACPDDPDGIKKLHEMEWDRAAQWCAARILSE